MTAGLPGLRTVPSPLAPGRTNFTSCRSPGSDFHAPDRPGRWVGSITIPPADLECPWPGASGPTSESIFGQLG